MLFKKDKRTISEHISNIFKESELDEKVVVRKFRTTTQHGTMADKTQQIEVNAFNLDVIISVGYRVKSPRVTKNENLALAEAERLLDGFLNR